MAQKPKGFGEPLHHKQQQKDLQRLAKRLRNQMGDQLGGVKFNPFGEVKMSEVLESFVAPYVEFTDNRSQRQKLLEIAVVAWNLALLEEKERRSMLEDTIAQFIPINNATAQQDFLEILDEMVARKLEFFAEFKRVIVNFELKDTGREYQLSVASLMDAPSATQGEERNL